MEKGKEKGCPLNPIHRASSSEDERRIPGEPTQSTVVESQSGVAPVRRVNTARCWSRHEEEVLAEMCRRHGEMKTWEQIRQDLMAETGICRTVPAVKARWAKLKAESQARQTLAEGVGRSEQAEMTEVMYAEALPERIEGFEVYGGRADQILTAICRRYEGERRMPWKHVIAPEFRTQTNLQYSDDKIRQRWSTIKTKRFELQRPELEGAQSGERNPDSEDNAEPTLSVAQACLTSETRQTAEPSLDPFANEEIPADFLNIFNTVLNTAKRSFRRKPVKKPTGKVTPLLLSYGSRLIQEHFVMKPQTSSALGWLNALTYAAAVAITTMQAEQARKTPSREAEELWYRERKNEKARLQKTIQELEWEVQRRIERRQPTRKERESLKKLKEIVGGTSTKKLRQTLEYLKQRHQLLMDRVNLRLEEKARKYMRKRFQRNPNINTLLPKRTDQQPVPDMEKTLQYWKEIIGERRSVSPEENEVLQEWSNLTHTRNSAEPVPKEEIEAECWGAIEKMRPWKACGPDGIHAGWWKLLPAAKCLLVSLVVDSIQTGRIPLSWIARGYTVLLYKKGDPAQPENYRPITCLNTCYKVITATVNRLTLNRAQDMIPREQRALKKERACMHAMLLDQCLAKSAQYRRKSLCVAWLDFSKAFDSVAHDYLKWLLQNIHLPNTLYNIIERAISGWRTRFVLNGKKSREVKYENGIFQGDSLSPTLFALSTAPISYILRTRTEAYRTSYGRLTGTMLDLNHQFYMDDLKLYARSTEQLNHMLDSVKMITVCMGLKLNTDKCAFATYRPEDRATYNIQLPELSEGETYKYLGIQQYLVNTDAGYEKLKTEFLSTTLIILKSNLTIRQQRQAYASIAVAKMKYFYQMTNGATKRLNQALSRARDLDKEVRRLLVCNGQTMKSTVVDRIYLPTEFGGLGWRSLEDEMEECTVEVLCYVLLNKELANVLSILRQQKQSGKRNVLTDAFLILESYGLSLLEQADKTVKFGEDTFEDSTTLARKIKAKLRETKAEARRNNVTRGQAAGRYFRNQELDLEVSSLWMKAGLLSAVNARNAIAVQDCSLTTRTHPVRVADGLCRQCRSGDESADHIVSHCAKWLPTLYVDRHNAVARNIHYWICKKYQVTPPHYSQSVPPVIESPNVKILWDSIIQTKTVLCHRKPDIVVFDKKAHCITVIEVSVASLNSLQHQREVKINRYKVNSTRQEDANKVPYEAGPNLIADLRATYGQEVRFLPFVIGVSGEVLKGTVQEVTHVLEMTAEEVRKLMERCQRAAVIGTSRIVKNHMAGR